VTYVIDVAKTVCCFHFTANVLHR